jgi:hypothetical protein
MVPTQDFNGTAEVYLFVYSLDNFNGKLYEWKRE